MLNRVVLMGRLTKKPELRRTQSGVAVTSFSLAVDRDYKDAEGNRETDFIDVVAWRGTAEFAAKYLDKGRMAAVTGTLQGRSWQDKDGNKRRSMEVLADSIYFADSKREETTGTGVKVPCLTLRSVDVSADDFQEVEDDGDLPF